MTYDRGEFVESAHKKQREKQDQSLPQIIQIRSAGHSAELLTGQPEWDKFLGYLAAVREQIEQDRERLTAELDDIDTVDPDVVMGITTRRAAMATNLKLLDAVMQLPLDLIKGGKEAGKIMERFTSASTAA